jgi:UDP-N-acetyl-D-mannosaminuronic acid transferase (WecB/TagA/CpsF family)
VASQLFPGKLYWNIGGGTLRFHAGTQRRVPRIVSILGTQWLWRMVFEPRIAPRYVIGIPVFAKHLLHARRAEMKKGPPL